jgi:L-arabinose isomerase
MIVNDVECVEQINDTPKLPVSAVLWKPAPNLKTSAEAWIYAGAAHHSVLSYDVTAEQMEDWARIMGIEYVHIGKDTTVASLEKELMLNDLLWKLQ